MKVILLKSVPKVGKANEIIEVSDGYAKHALFPKKLAIPATEKAVAALKQEQRTLLEQTKLKHEQYDQFIKEIQNNPLRVPVRSNEVGNLFSKINNTEIGSFLKEYKNFEIDDKVLFVADGPIKKIGTHLIKIIDGEYKSTFEVELIRI